MDEWTLVLMSLVTVASFGGFIWWVGISGANRFERQQAEAVRRVQEQAKTARLSTP